MKLYFHQSNFSRRCSVCNVTPIIGSNDDKWNDFDEMIRRIKTNLSSENCFEHDLPNDDDDPCTGTRENICGTNQIELTQVKGLLQKGHRPSTEEIY